MLSPPSLNFVAFVPSTCASINQAVILAGGIGSRLRPLTDSLPKPMIAFHGRPFAAYLVDRLREQGITEVIFLLGYLSEKVIEYFGDGSAHGVRIRYSVQSVETETGGRLRTALPLLQEHFLLLYCDNYWPLKLEPLVSQWRRSGVEAILTVYSNEDHFTRDNLRVSKEGLIEVYDKTRKAPGLSGVDIGFGIFSRRHVENLPEGNVSFEKEAYADLVKRGQLAGHVTRLSYYSIGSLERLPLTESFLKGRRVVFLDRDGVLNRKAPKGCYVTCPEEFFWLQGSLEAVVRLSKAGYRICLVTNQAGIARGMIKPENLARIHERLRCDVAAENGLIDAIYCCPHHWDEKCDCRKPQPGMFIAAQRELRCDLTKAFFVGDQEDDRLASERAGCRFKLKREDHSLLEIAEEIIREDSL